MSDIELSRLEMIERDFKMKKNINPSIDTILNSKELGNLPEEIFTELEENDTDYYYLRHGAIGDGNCLYHSILNLIEENYLSLSIKNKTQRCLEFKKKLAKNITEHDYNYIKLKKNYPTLKKYKDHLLKNRKWGTGEDIIYISSFLNINIFVFQLYDTDVFNPNCIQFTVYDEERPTILLYNFKNMHFESIIRLSKDQSVQTKHFTSENITHESKMFNPNNNAINKLSIKYRSKCLKISNMFLRNWRNSDIYKCKTDIYTAVDGWELPDNRGFCPINKRYLHKITRVEDDDDTPDTCCHSTIDITDSGKENVLELSKKSMPKAQSKTQSKADIERLSVLEQLKIMGFNDSSLNNQLYDIDGVNIVFIYS